MLFARSKYFPFESSLETTSICSIFIEKILLIFKNYILLDVVKYGKSIDFIINSQAFSQVFFI